MNVAIGLLCVSLGVVLLLTGVVLAVGEVISGRHGAGSAAQAYAGNIFEGIQGVLNAAAALAKAMGDWKLPAWFLFFGIVLIGVGLWLLVANPIHEASSVATALSAALHPANSSAIAHRLSAPGML
jgi:hypothetical protein